MVTSRVPPRGIVHPATGSAPHGPRAPIAVPRLRRDGPGHAHGGPGNAVRVVPAPPAVGGSQSSVRTSTAPLVEEARMLLSEPPSSSTPMSTAPLVDSAWTS